MAGNVVSKVGKAHKKVKKHGVKAGQKSLIRPSQKKAVKNGRHQEKEVVKKKVKKTIAATKADLDGEILDDALEPSDERLEPSYSEDGALVDEDFDLPDPDSEEDFEGDDECDATAADIDRDS